MSTPYNPIEPDAGEPDPAWYAAPSAYQAGSGTAYQAGPIPSLAGVSRDTQGRLALTFRFPPATDGQGQPAAGYACTLWADADRTLRLPPTQTVVVAGTQVTFAGVPAGAPWLLDVVPQDGAGGAVVLTPALSLVGASPLPGQDVAGAADPPAPVQEDAPLMLFGERPVYGAPDGVRRWARVVTFGSGRDQVSTLDVLYFLMAASDLMDARLAGRYGVPLTRYRTGEGGVYRFPPGVSLACERLAAGLLIQSRKSVLTEQVASYGQGLEQAALGDVDRLAAGPSLLGQTQSPAMLPSVYNPNPRQFAMPGDPAGLSWDVATGSPDMRVYRQGSLPVAYSAWAFGPGREFWLG